MSSEGASTRPASGATNTAKRPARVRKNILQLDKIELQSLNDGFEALVAAEGPGGYQHLAGIYGQPGQPYQPTAPLLFLPWHRAYLLAFEQALGRFLPGLSLAYWKWTDESALFTGIPGRLRTVAYTDKDHGIWLNALCRAPVDFLGYERYTERSPGRPGDLDGPIRTAREATGQTRFEDFSAGLQKASQDLRAWVGGHTGDDALVAYDPLFWFHHANLDRIWVRWREAHGEVALPESLLDAELEPFRVTVRDVLEVERLAYAYDDGC